MNMAVAPVITLQPQSQTNVVGGTASFSVGGERDGPVELSVELERDEPGGGHERHADVNNVQLAQAGNYSVLVSNLPARPTVRWRS